ncbi:A24 family peptidase [Nocardia sp. NPDC052112]|uniref:A24 family peptidase n=1 Tax=Nocardia sp. NPDC052112 TaxID=3155646 RepID=UPI003421D4E6
MALAFLVAWCSMLTICDIRQRRLPNALTAYGALIIFGYALITTQFTAAMAGSILLALPYLLVHLIAPEALGAGDVKLAIGLGAVTALGGAQVWVRAALIAPILTAVFGIALSAHWRIRSGADQGGPHALPHGPAMCLATLLSLAAAHG